MQLESAVSRAENLCIFPKSALKIRTVVTSAETSFGDLERAVAIDPTLAAQVLKIANSPFFGLSRQIKDLKQALVLIGYEATRDLALALALLSLAKRDDGSTSYLWQHSLGTGLSARMLAEAGRPELAGEAFVAGLLHDLGKLVGRLLHDSDGEAAGDYPLVERSTRESTQRERDYCGFTHAELGAACLESWSLGKLTCNAIRHHHDPNAFESDTESGFLARVLFLANEVSHEPERTVDAWQRLLDDLSLQETISVDDVRSAAMEAPNAAERLGLT